MQTARTAWTARTATAPSLKTISAWLQTYKICPNMISGALSVEIVESYLMTQMTAKHTKMIQNA